METSEEEARQAKQEFLIKEIIEKNYNSELFLEFCERKKSSDIDEWTFKELQECVKQFKEQIEFEQGKSVKKEFLIREIVDSGYDSQLFLEFCEEQKTSDMDQWSLEELKVCVKEFKGKFKSVKSTLEEKVKENEERKDETQKKTEHSDKENNENKTIKLTKILTNELYFMEDLKITVSDPEIVDPGFFSTKYYLFVVNTQPANWVVKRKIEEFLWIRDVLATSYPGIFIPSIHKSTKNKLEPKGVFKRIFIYSAFINNVVSNPLLRSSSYLLAFLKEQELKSLIKSFKKAGKPKDISDVKSIEGEIACIYEENAQKFEALNLYLQKAEKILNELVEKFKKLIMDSLKVSESIKEYSHIVKELEPTNFLIKNEIASTMYSGICECLLGWSNFVEKSTKNIYEDLKVPFMLYRNELLTLRDLIKERDNALAAYKSSVAKPNAIVLKDIFGYFNSVCLRQVEKVLKDITDQLKYKLIQGFKLKGEESVQFHLVWGALIASLTNASD